MEVKSRDLQVGDIIEFTEPGLYIVELYTFPSYEFAKNFVNRVISTGEDSTLNNYYVRFEFEIEKGLNLAKKRLVIKWLDNQVKSIAKAM